MIRFRKRRLKAALTTPLRSRNLLQLGLLLIGLAILLLFIGFKSDFLKVNVLQKPWQ